MDFMQMLNGAGQAAPAPEQAPAQPRYLDKSPPADENDLAQRKSSWMEHIQGVMDKPGMRDALLQVGLRLMQGYQPGQSTGQVVADALGKGFVAHRMANENMENKPYEDRTREAEVGRKEAEALTAKTRADVQSSTRNEQIESIRLATQQARADLAKAKTSAEREAIKAEWETRLGQIRGQFDDDSIAMSVGAELEKPQLENQRTRAQIGESAARASQARAYAEKAGIPKVGKDSEYSFKQRVEDVKLTHPQISQMTDGPAKDAAARQYANAMSYKTTPDAAEQRESGDASVGVENLRLRYEQLPAKERGKKTFQQWALEELDTALTLSDRFTRPVIEQQINQILKSGGSGPSASGTIGQAGGEGAKRVKVRNPKTGEMEVWEVYGNGKGRRVE